MSHMTFSEAGELSLPFWRVNVVLMTVTWFKCVMVGYCELSAMLLVSLFNRFLDRGMEMIVACTLLRWHLQLCP